MRKVALAFVLAVIVPSLVLAWLAVRSLRDQQFLIERQQSLLDQRATDSVAQNISRPAAAGVFLAGGKSQRRSGCARGGDNI